MKIKTKILVAAIIAAVISLVVMCSVCDFSAARVKAVFSVLFFVSVVTAGSIACTNEGGIDDDI